MMIPHNKLKNRYEFRGFLQMETALHVGTGQKSSITDAGVVRDFKGNPFIPGSSLKGALRSAIERRVEWLGLRSCRLEEGFADCLTTNKRAEREVNGTPWRKQPLSWRLSEMQSGLCDVCKLFGSTVFGGKVQVDDLPLEEDFEKIASFLIEVRDGVGIDRDSGITVEGAKFDYEVVPSLTVFRFYLTAENLDERDMALLSLGLLEMMNGVVPIGGKSTRGLGRCYLHLTNAFFFEFPENDQITTVQRILEYLKPENERCYGKIQNPKDFLAQKIQVFTV